MSKKAVYLVAVDFGAETTSVVLARASMAIEEEKITEVEIESPFGTGRFEPELGWEMGEIAKEITKNFMNITKDFRIKKESSQCQPTDTPPTDPPPKPT